MNNPNSKKIVAAFDFDGTLTYRDTLLPFLLYSCGKAETLLAISSIIPQCVGFVTGWRTRQQVKEKLLTHTFKGQPLDKIQALGEIFAKERINSLLKPEAMERLRWHQQQNHRCVLISASLDVYLAPWTKLMDIDDLICTSLETDSHHNITGKIKGNNCWGPEKLLRLQNLLGDRESYSLYVYGDSRGDKEILDFADFPYYRKFE